MIVKEFLNITASHKDECGRIIGGYLLVRIVLARRGGILVLYGIKKVVVLLRASGRRREIDTMLEVT